MVELVREGRTPQELAREYEPSAQTIEDWVKLAASDGEHAPIGFTGRDGGGSRIRRFVDLVREGEDNRPARKPDAATLGRKAAEETRPSPRKPDASAKSGQKTTGTRPSPRKPDVSAKPGQRASGGARKSPASKPDASVELGPEAHEGAQKAPARKPRAGVQPSQKARVEVQKTPAPKTDAATPPRRIAQNDSPPAAHQPIAPPPGTYRTLHDESLLVDGGDRVHLGRTLRIVWERKWIVIATVFVTMALAFVLTRQMVPLYVAQSLLMIENRPMEIVEVEAVVGGLTIDSLTIQTEVSVLESRGLAEKVVERVKLNEDPEFNATLRPPPEGLPAHLATAREWLSELIGARRDANAPAVVTDTEHDQYARVIDAYLKRLAIAAKNKSRAILVKFTSANPATAALVANTVADLYVLAQRENKLEAAQQATDWLSERSAALREKVAASEHAIEKFKEENQLLEFGRGTLVSEQISDVNAELTKVATSRAQLQARLAQVPRVGSNPENIDSAVEVLESPVIRRLQKEHVDLVRQRTELSSKYNPSHTRIVSLDAEIGFIEKQIGSEIDKIVKGLENELAVAQNHETLLQKSLDELKVRAVRADNAVVKLRELEREAEADRMLLTTFLSRLKETSAQRDLEFHPANARILSRATVPRQPIPKRKVVLVVTFAGSLLIGVLLAALMERRRTSDVFLSGDQIERFARAPYLGLIPLVPKRAADSPASHAVQQPRSAFAESIRGLYASIQLSNIHAPPKIIMFTSAQPNEGKTTIAVSLARAQALNGKRVVIIDTDIRRPGVHLPFAMSNEPGLSDLLQGTVSLEQVMRKDEVSGAYVIPAGTGTLNPFDALCATPMEELLIRLSRSGDLVILDTPPLLAVPDARMLCGKVDATVFAIRWAETKREVAALAIRQITESNGQLAGVLLSMVDTRKNAKYGYGDSGYYTGAAASYYSAARTADG